jgi:hypothetical protein
MLKLQNKRAICTKNWNLKLEGYDDGQLHLEGSVIQVHKSWAIWKLFLDLIKNPNPNPNPQISMMRIDFHGRNTIWPSTLIRISQRFAQLNRHEFRNASLSSMWVPFLALYCLESIICSPLNSNFYFTNFEILFCKIKYFTNGVRHIYSVYVYM